MSWATAETSIKIRETALADNAIDVGGNECLLKRGACKALIASSVTQYNKMHECSLCIGHELCAQTCGRTPSAIV